MNGPIKERERSQYETKDRNVLGIDGNKKKTRETLYEARGGNIPGIIEIYLIR